MGASRTSGRIKGLKQSKISVSTPVADIGVRGTEFWGGRLDDYGVLVLEGEITLSNQAGSVTLSGSSLGTDIPSRSIRQVRSRPGARRRLLAPSPP
jgi:hypothetical protein